MIAANKRDIPILKRYIKEENALDNVNPMVTLQLQLSLATALATSFLTIGKNAATGSAAFRFTNGVHYGMYFTIALTIIGFIIALFIKDDGNYTD